MAVQLSQGRISGINIDKLSETKWFCVDGSNITPESSRPLGDYWTMVLHFKITDTISLQVATDQYGGQMKIRVKWDGSFKPWMTVFSSTQ